MVQQLWVNLLYSIIILAHFQLVSIFLVLIRNVVGFHFCSLVPRLSSEATISVANINILQSPVAVHTKVGKYAWKGKSYSSILTTVPSTHFGNQQYLYCLREVHNGHEEVLDQEHEADEEGNHTNSYSEVARIIIIPTVKTYFILLHFVRNTAKHNDGEQLRERGGTVKTDMAPKLKKVLYNHAVVTSIIVG